MTNMYTTLKIPLNDIIKDINDSKKINDAVNKINQLVIHVSQFLRLWILHKYDTDAEIPKLTEDIIKMAFCALTETVSRGAKPQGENGKFFNEFQKFYADVYSKLGYTTKISARNLSSIIEYECTDVLTNIENNIKLHFSNYVRQYVNGCFRDKHDEILERLSGKTKKEMTIKLRNDLKLLKQDILNNTIMCDKQYHDWLNEQRSKIFPSGITEFSQIDINHDPQRYLPNMIFMNKGLESKGKKMFQFFPLRTHIVPKYITIDTTAIVYLLVNGKRKYLNDIENTKHEVWNTHFHMDNKIFKVNDYCFDYMISTDGYVASIQFMQKDAFQTNNQQKSKRQSAKKNTDERRAHLVSQYKSELMDTITTKMKADGASDKEIQSEITKEAKAKASTQLSKEKADKKAKEAAIKKAKHDAYIAELKKLSKERRRELAAERKKKTKVEFPYLDELQKEELAIVKAANKVYVDPGKKCLLMMMDDNGVVFRYTNAQRLHETRRLKYQTLLHNYRESAGILKIEEKLSGFNRKTCSYDAFAKYVSKKNEINSMLFEAYRNEKFRRYNWYSYINTKRSEANLLNKIEEVYGKDCILIYGDWSIGKQMRNFISTPNIGLKRKLHERFTIYSLDEFRTSCLDYQTESMCNNLYFTDKDGEYQKLHSVLTFQMANGRLGCRNRDLNSVKNMKKIIDHWFKTGNRLLKYSRTYKFDKVTRRANPNDGTKPSAASNSSEPDGTITTNVKPKRKTVKSTQTTITTIKKNANQKKVSQKKSVKNDIVIKE